MAKSNPVRAAGRTSQSGPDKAAAIALIDAINENVMQAAGILDLIARADGSDLNSSTLGGAARSVARLLKAIHDDADNLWLIVRNASGAQEVQS